MHGYFLRDTQLGREEGPQQQQGYLGCNLDKTGWIQCNYILNCINIKYLRFIFIISDSAAKEAQTGN